jgi:MFS family permease
MSVFPESASGFSTAGSSIPSPAPPQRTGQLILLAFASATSLFARTAINPLQETLRIALGLSDNDMALLQGTALALPMVLLTIPVGLLVDRTHGVRLLLLLAALSVGAHLLTAFATTFLMLFGARCLIGLTVTATGTTVFSLLADLYSPTERGRASMVVVLAQYVGIASAFAAGGFLIDTHSAHSNGWRASLLWMTTPIALMMAAVLAVREPPRVGVGIADRSVRASFRELWRLRGSILPLFIGLTLLQMAFQPTLVWAAPILARKFSLSPDRIGTLVATGVIISGIVGSVAGGLLTDLSQRAGGPRGTLILLSALAALSVPTALFPMMHSLAASGTCLALLMTLVSALEVSGTALFTVIVPNELRGLCISALAAGVMILGVGIGPVLVSMISGVLGGPSLIGYALAVVAATAGILGAAMFAYGSAIQRRQQR